VRRFVAVVVATLMGVGTAIGANATPAQAARAPIAADFFGMHDHELSSALPYGAVRFWDDDTIWASLEPAPNVYRFGHLDARVATALARHAKITLVLGSTPAWAATDPNALSSAWLPPGSSSPPRLMSDWVNYVRTVVTRYRGRIDSYQIWNEASLPQFWHSTPYNLAQLTKAAYPVIKSVDRNAKVVSTPMLPRQPTWSTWSKAYLKALRKARWPVDVFAIHSYQRDKRSSPAGRVFSIKRMKRVLVAAHAPHRPMWDTEGNYTSNSYAKYKITGKRSAIWVARAYLDSLRLGVSRTYWYAWNQPVGHLGITLGPDTTAAQGYKAIEKWLVGRTFQGCRKKRAPTGVKVTTCSFTRGAKTSRVLWASADKHTLLTGPGRTVCRLLTGCTARTKKTKVTSAPMLVR
jgi:hypothetical protein